MIVKVFIVKFLKYLQSSRLPFVAIHLSQDEHRLMPFPPQSSILAWEQGRERLRLGSREGFVSWVYFITATNMMAVIVDTDFI